jgi:hypothetical protein
MMARPSKVLVACETFRPPVSDQKLCTIFLPQAILKIFFSIMKEKAIVTALYRYRGVKGSFFTLLMKSKVSKKYSMRKRVKKKPKKPLI